ncbi:hypothetical protein AKO1_004335 [Acrasis kona]|uniref:Uncharacterized protein n=1 Tax=Acrasis kona TaxID=1008807 RepID=A0AAW2Z877_9EUKA
MTEEMYPSLFSIYTVTNNEDICHDAIKQMEEVVQKISTKEDYAKEIVLDIFKPLLRVYTITSTKNSIIDQHMHDLSKNLLELLSQIASPREVYSVIMEHFSLGCTSKLLDSLMLDRTNDYAHDIDMLDNCLLILVHLLNTVLLRTTSKRDTFVKNIFVTITEVLSLQVISPTMSELNDPERLEEINKQRDLSERRYSKFCQSIILITSTISKSFNNKSLLDIQLESKTFREHHLVLYMCFNNLAKIFSSDELIQKLSSEAIDFMKVISNCNCPYLYLMGYAQRELMTRDLKNKSIQEEMELFGELIDSDDEEGHDEKELNINHLGLAIFSHLVNIGVESERYDHTCALDPVHNLLLNRTYICNMLQSPIPCYSKIAKDQLYILLDRVPSGSMILQSENKQKDFLVSTSKNESGVKTRLDEIRGKVDHLFKINVLVDHFNLAQSLLNFVASCPDDTQRNDAFNVMNMYIDKFNDDGRFEILRNVIITCPFKSITGLLVLRLKDELRLEYDSVLNYIKNKKINVERPYQPGQPNSVIPSERVVPQVQMDAKTVSQIKIHVQDSKAFLQKGRCCSFVLEVILKNLWTVSEPVSEEDVDLIMHCLNVIYFLLLRDGHVNATGVMESSFLDNLKNKVLTPIRISVDDLLQELTSTEKTSEEDDVDTDDLNLSDLEEDEDMDEFDRQAVAELRERIINKKNRVFFQVSQEEKQKIKLRLYVLLDMLDDLDKLI